MRTFRPVVVRLVAAAAWLASPLWAQPADQATEQPLRLPELAPAVVAGAALTPESLLSAENERRARLEQLGHQYLARARSLVQQAATTRQEPGFAEARDCLVLAEEALMTASRSKPRVTEALRDVHRELTKTFVTWAETLVALGDERAKAKDYAGAIKLYQRAVKLCPTVNEVTAGRLTEVKAAAAKAAFAEQVKAGTL